MSSTNERIKEVVDFALSDGDEACCSLFGINIESLSRYKRQYKKINEKQFEGKKLIRDIKESFTEKELSAMLKSKKSGRFSSESVKHDFDGDEITFGYITDTHFGSVYFNEDLLFSFYDECEKQGVDFICHTGDVSEGMSNRPDHIYQLTHLGYDQQKEYCINLLSQYEKPMYLIDGNHDRWFFKSNGALIVKDVCKELDHLTFLGNDEGYINLKDVIIQLWHGEDGSSYAVSYRLQKLIESFTGGEKPHVLLAGHTHKQMYMIERNVHVVSGGALSYQSKWMRSKKLSCVTGFHIIKMCVRDKEVQWFEPRFYPFYKPLSKQVGIEV